MLCNFDLKRRVGRQQLEPNSQIVFGAVAAAKRTGGEAKTMPRTVSKCVEQQARRNGGQLDMPLFWFEY
jgi:hypothetical protein